MLQEHFISSYRLQIISTVHGRQILRTVPVIQPVIEFNQMCSDDATIIVFYVDICNAVSKATSTTVTGHVLHDAFMDCCYMVAFVILPVYSFS